ncbi:hypothetical protein G6L35_26240 [Agrobacterium tumefaciens]|uniref:hypothetical protein n=1 Tax=Agrobacterium tumefaciens TaxID=358 RepID=UPI0015721955|nr:hypothetical protein [Agrobacterium tumefaciens]NSZ72098.1 hypothetical protein [Agrobacterium tumefaciens]
MNGSDTITGTNTVAFSVFGFSIRQSSLRRHMATGRASNSEMTASGSKQAATRRSLSSRDQRRRRSTDVITSIGVVNLTEFGP